MQYIQTINAGSIKQSATHGGCGECQASCQSACKTSCTVANQSCERITEKDAKPRRTNPKR
jgi:predicted ribosomally synthesized six-cysteine peptide SCIFF